MSYQNIIGLFPLKLFLLNQEQTTLHIYEPKYLQLIHECIEQEACFGIPYQSTTKLHEYGCVVKVVEISKIYQDGQIDVKIECLQNFKLTSFEAQKEDRLYPNGTVTLLENQFISPTEELTKLANDYNHLLFNKLLTASDSENIQQIISLLSLENEEKLKLFRYNPLKKIQFLIHKLKYMSILVHQEKMVEHQYHLN